MPIRSLRSCGRWLSGGVKMTDQLGMRLVVAGKHLFHELVVPALGAARRDANADDAHSIWPRSLPSFGHQLASAESLSLFSPPLVSASPLGCPLAHRLHCRTVRPRQRPWATRQPRRRPPPRPRPRRRRPQPPRLQRTRRCRSFRPKRLRRCLPSAPPRWAQRRWQCHTPALPKWRDQRARMERLRVQSSTSDGTWSERHGLAGL